MLHAGEGRSRASLTGRCWATVENLDPELSAGSTQGAQQRSGLSVPGVLGQS